MASEGWQSACVAMASRNARILWAVMKRKQGFDARNASARPPGKQGPRASQQGAAPDLHDLNATRLPTNLLTRRPQARAEGIGYGQSANGVA